MPLDVPAHVQHAAHVENNVQVQPGSNWDFSRTARVTPIVPESEQAQRPAPAAGDSRYESRDAMPEGAPLAIAQFGDEGILIGGADQQALLELSPQSLIVAAHSDAGESDARRLSNVRAAAIASLLRSHGHTVVAVKSFGSERPAAEGGAHNNRIVAVFATQ